MKDKLDDIVSKVLADVPKQVGLKLPKLQKVTDENLPSVKLPKLKKA